MNKKSRFNPNVVDACYIVPFAQSYDDINPNCIALSPTLLRACCRGLVSVIAPDIDIARFSNRPDLKFGYQFTV